MQIFNEIVYENCWKFSNPFTLCTPKKFIWKWNTRIKRGIEDRVFLLKALLRVWSIYLAYSLIKTDHYYEKFLMKNSWIILFQTSRFFVGALAIFSGVRSTISWKATQITSGVFWRGSTCWTNTLGKSPVLPSAVEPDHHSPLPIKVINRLKSRLECLTFHSRPCECFWIQVHAQ